MLVALQLLDWESDLIEVLFKEDKVQVMDRFPEHGGMGRLHGTHGSINEIDLLFEQVPPAVNERADVFAELCRGEDLRFGDLRQLMNRFLPSDNGCSQVNRANEFDCGIEVLCEDFGVARDLETCVESTVHGLVVSRHSLGTSGDFLAQLKLLRGSDGCDRAFVMTLLADGRQNLVCDPALEAFGAFEL